MKAFHWHRAVVQSGLVMSMCGTVCTAWPAGWLIDRIGVRAVALLSQLGLACGFCLLAAQTGDPALWRASWFLLAVLGIGTSPLTWSRGIAAWFVQARGTAIGIALAGTGLTAFLAPPIVGRLIALAGWRAAYAAMAAVILLVGLPVVWCFFRAPARSSIAPAVLPTSDASGVSIGQALGNWRFWLIMFCFAAVSFGVGGAIPNIVSMLVDQGRHDTSLYASLLGLCVIAGRLLTGLLIDRIWAPAVAAVVLSIPALACWLLANATAPAFAAALIGVAGGAEFDLLSFLCVRYFGLRNYGQIYALQWASFCLAAGVGAYHFARSFDVMGSYAPALDQAAVGFIVGGASLLALGRYPTGVARAVQLQSSGASSA